MYADDTLVYNVINGIDDCIQFQNDLLLLERCMGKCLVHAVQSFKMQILSASVFNIKKIRLHKCSKV